MSDECGVCHQTLTWPDGHKSGAVSECRHYVWIQSEDEEFVRSHWGYVHERVQSSIREAPIDSHGFVFNNPDERISSLMGTGLPKERWSAAAEFTTERLEQIRQLKRELLVLGNIRDRYARDTFRCISGESSILGRDLEGCWAMCAYTVGRTLDRLESALADLQRGMKSPELVKDEREGNDNGNGK